MLPPLLVYLQIDREEVIKMVVGSLSQEVKCSVAPARIWKAAVVDIHNLLPKIAPHFISSMEMIEGDGGAGSVFLTTLAKGLIIDFHLRFLSMFV